MKISNLFNQNKPLISFEFFPPKTPAGMDSLMTAISSLKKLNPSFVSMTYGAGGSTREKTVQLVSKIKHEIGLEAAAHLTCVGHTREELLSVLTDLKQAGIENIMALRGDPPKGQTNFVKVEGGFGYASELVAFIRKNFDFDLGVAGYPEKHIEASSMKIDLENLKKKVDAGADFIVTQLFFDNKDYYSFVENVRSIGITVPIVAGIMPIKDLEQIKRFASMCGAKIPANLLVKLESAKGDQQKVIDIGIQHATTQCEDLLKNGAPGIHFYTLNKSQSTVQIYLKLLEKSLVVQSS